MPEPAGTILPIPAILTADPSAVSGIVVLGLMGGGSDVSAPTVGNYSPPAGTPVEAADPVFFDVTDNSGLFRRVLVLVKQLQTWELVHDGDEFVTPYLAQSSRENVPGGYRYRVRRSGGWVSDVWARVFAYDLVGNEAVS